MTENTPTFEVENKAVDIFKRADKDNALLKYKKSGVIQVKEVTPGTEIQTIINGQLETKNIAQEGDFLVTNSTGEVYLLSTSKLNDRYTFLGKSEYGPDVELWTARGIAWAIQYTGDESFTFKAPWNEDMLCNPGDFIVSPVRGQYTDVYRIEQSIMDVTYKQIPT
jgi:hypothetical protein